MSESLILGSRITLEECHLPGCCLPTLHNTWKSESVMVTLTWATANGPFYRLRTSSLCDRVGPTAIRVVGFDETPSAPGDAT